MKKFFGVMLVCVALSVPFIAAAGSWGGWGQITTVVEYGSGIRIQGPSLSVNPAGCTGTDWAFIDSSRSDAFIDRLNKVALSAFLSGREARVKLDSTKCQENHPVVYSVQVR